METVTYLYKKARSLLEERIFRDIIIIDFEDEKKGKHLSFKWIREKIKHVFKS